MLFPGLFQRRMSRVVAMTFVMLIVSPVTAPFQAVTLAGLLQGSHHGRAVHSAAAPRPRLESAPVDTVAAILPPDSPELRLKLHAQGSAPTEHSVKSCAEVFYSLSPRSGPFGGTSIVVLRI